MVVVFQNREQLESLRPAPVEVDGVMVEPLLELPSGVLVGTPVEGADGRLACVHPFTEEDIAFLTERGLALSDNLPEDWVYPSL
jgi:hypothetical protein